MAKDKAPKAAQTTDTPKTPGINDYVRHDLSEQFKLPSNSDDQLGIGMSMSKHGQQHEIILYEGKVLDGWDRLMACKQKGLTPKFKNYEGDDPVGFLVSMHLNRRKLTSLQKGLIAAKFYLHHRTPDGQRYKQDEVRKMYAVSLNRLSEFAQLLESKHADAKRCVKEVAENPEYTAASLERVLIAAGIRNANTQVDTREQAAPPASSRVTVPGNNGDDPHAESDDDNVDEHSRNLVGGDIDDILGSDFDQEHPDADDPPEPKSGSRERDLSGGFGMGDTGTRPNHPERQPTVTEGQAMSTKFKAVSAGIREEFIRLAWPTLRPALEKMLREGDAIRWKNLAEIAEAHETLPEATPLSALVKAVGGAAVVAAATENQGDEGASEPTAPAKPAAKGRGRSKAKTAATAESTGTQE